MPIRPFSKKKLFIGVAAVAALGVAGFLILTSPWTWSAIHPDRDVADSSQPDLVNGKNIFIASDCATCHATPGKHDPTDLGGGRILDTAFGKFHMSNISPDPNDGIGGWTLQEFTRAVREGVGPGGMLPDGENLYPAFPYTSYQRLTANDVRDMFAYIQTLPAVASQVPEHELKFPYNLRRGIGVWRLAFLDGKPLNEVETAADVSIDPVLDRGRYLVEGAGHCVECHSPRNFMGVIAESDRYGGGKTPEGEGYFPNISQHDTGIKFWAEASMVRYLKTGISPLGKTAGGDMAEVIENTSKLPESDLRAMAAYLKTLPGVDSPAPGQPPSNYTSKLQTVPIHRFEVPMPTSTVDQLGSAETVYVVKAKPFFIEEAFVGQPDQRNGKLLGAAKLKILARNGSHLNVSLEGWQPEGVTSAIYAERGKRIMSAVVDEAASASIEQGEPVRDSSTGTWIPVKLNLWVDDADLNVEVDRLWAFSSDLLRNSCATCHSLNEPHHFTANQWIGTLGSMRRYTSLDEDQYRLLLAYVQNHASDMAHDEASAK